jgi:rfaE bifunctional protein nucleotidyltransferase chain/domain
MPRAEGKLVPRTRLAELGRRLRRARRTVVFTNGCFDLIHPGHVALLEEARRHGDVLVVGLNSDRSVRDLKGPGRPLIGQRDRSRMLAALECVDHVTIFSEPTPLKTIRLLRPAVLVKGSDWKRGEIVGRDEVEKAGGRVVRVPLKGAYSTTKLLEHLRRGR